MPMMCARCGLVPQPGDTACRRCGLSFDAPGALVEQPSPAADEVASGAGPSLVAGVPPGVGIPPADAVPPSAPPDVGDPSGGGLPPSSGAPPYGAPPSYGAMPTAASPGAVCPNCGLTLPVWQPNCPNCGAAMAVTTTWPPPPGMQPPVAPAEEGKILTGSPAGDVGLGSLLGLVMMCFYGIGVIGVPITYVVLRKRYPHFARGMGITGLLLGLVALGLYAICSSSKF